jgi:hypothetical protein
MSHPSPWNARVFNKYFGQRQASGNSPLHRGESHDGVSKRAPQQSSGSRYSDVSSNWVFIKIKINM